MKIYFVKPECYSEWSDNDMDAAKPITESELLELSRAWGIPANELLEQLVEESE